MGPGHAGDPAQGRLRDPGGSKAGMYLCFKRMAREGYVTHQDSHLRKPTTCKTAVRLRPGSRVAQRSA